MKIILIRHGETEANIKRIAMGWSDVGLSKKGFEQAKKIAQELKDERINILYSSDLSRAVDTAKEISKFHKNIKFILDKNLREQNKGVYEGKPVGSDKKESDKLKILWHEFKPENGESFDNLLKRISKFYENLKKNENNNKTILIVTHGGPLCVLTAYLKKEDLGIKRKYRHKNASITIIEIDSNNNEKITKFNSIEHLK